jgi:hypothetical protein
VGVQVYLLDRRKLTLLIAGFPNKVGTLRRSWKVTEFDDERNLEIKDADNLIAEGPAPLAVILADTSEMPLAAEPNKFIRAHRVLGWDADRSSVTDYEWDFLPTIGFAVLNSGSSEYSLYEEVDGALSVVKKEDLSRLSILDKNQKLLRNGQPTIVECHSIDFYIRNYVQADCVLSNGQAAKLLTLMHSENLPHQAWYIGKRPKDVERYTL